MKSLSDDELRSAPLLVNGLLQKILHTAREFLGMEVAFISEFREGCRVFKLVDSRPEMHQLLNVDGFDPLEESYCQRVVDGRLPALMQNATQVSAALELPVTTSLPVGAHLSVPIYLENGAIYGTFCCFSRYPDYTLTERDLDVMRAYGNLASTLLSEFVAEDVKRLKSRRTLAAVIEEQAFEPVFQPIIRLQDMRVVGYEALTRFTSSRNRLTESWFSEAAQVGLACELETAATRKAVANLSRLLPNQFLSVNMSPETLLNCPNLVSCLGKDLTRIVIEITEHEEIKDYTAVARKLAPLRQRGLRLAVDDAGAGYASLRHILQLQPNIIKLDRSLIHNLDRDDSELALAKALVTFAKSTGALIIAEGVESEGELAALKTLEVSLAQGYLLAMPGPLQPPYKRSSIT